ncbi:hypothetical protein B0J11DRAFT_479903 [Dendryphion nanum]|uniref:BAG domain-containing protein n=1 Tax=Dendryphion nanum TaxID=256645 RepID=A0A9P9IYQ4_9PLEO|nr:hypothetical protein B0J11DRAFT_479903 [Dendryphion nanum]
MARRSARLQKHSPAPSDHINAHSTTAPQPDNLSSIVEDSEPPAMAQPMKVATPTAKPSQPISQLPQPSNAATPIKSKSSQLLLSAITARTPRNRTPLKPAGEEMHPALHHASTAKPLDEARWLGFQSLGSHTAPPKQSSTMIPGNTTPSKTPHPATPNKIFESVLSPKFNFRFKSPIPGLSPKSSRVLKDEKVSDNRTFAADEFSTPADIVPRKFAVPKGKSTRYSDAHKAQFKKMDSIANHASAFRADPSRFKPAGLPLKRSPSKADLDPAVPKAKGPNKLKRTQSKMDIAEPTPKPHVPTLLATPLRREQSKLDLTNSVSKLPRSQSTVRLVPPTRDGRPPTQDGRPPTQDGSLASKRVKRTETDDASTTRPVSRDNNVDGGKPAGRQLHSQTALPRLKSRLMTPTKATLARASSAKVFKTTSTIPSLARSPSIKNLFSPTNIAESMKEGIRKTSNSLNKVRSILRTPSRKYLEDPAKIVASTHASPLVSPLPGLDMLSALPKAPKTAPVRKHVNFSTSTLERAAHADPGKSPSPMKIRAGSEVPIGAVFYPKLHPNVEYPTLPDGEEQSLGSPSRRLTFGGVTATSSAQFLFQSDKPIQFGPAATGTIRMVRKSDAASLVEGTKRKLDNFEEASDKENSGPVEDDGRSAKKLKASPIKPPRTPSALSKLPRRLPKRSGSITQGRLAFLSTPKPDITDFLAKPRLDDPTYLTTLALLLAAVFVTMSWFSRAGGSGWAGRFSPFGRTTGPNSVGDEDFSYITSEDLANATGKGRHRASSRTNAPEIVDWNDKNPDRDTDVLIFKNGRTNYPAHFPVQSIRDGDLKISAVRQTAAKKLGVSDPSRIRLFFKGKNLKHDDRTAREEGLRGDGTGSEILCVVGDAGTGPEHGGIPGTSQQAWSDGSDEEDDTEGGTDTGLGTKKKTRKRGGRKSKKKNASATPTPPVGYSNANPTGAEFLPIPSNFSGPRSTSTPPTNAHRAATPATPNDKIDALASKFHTEFVPLCVSYINSPPEEKSKRDFEYKKLSETILAQILLKLDGVETEGDPDARAKRKALVKEVQGMLNKLDEIVKG